MMIPANTNMGTANSGKLSIPPNMERITKLPLAVKLGSNKPGNTATMPNEIDIGTAINKQMAKIINTTPTDILLTLFLYCIANFIRQCSFFWKIHILLQYDFHIDEPTLNQTNAC